MASIQGAKGTTSVGGRAQTRRGRGWRNPAAPWDGLYGGNIRVPLLLVLRWCLTFRDVDDWKDVH